MTRFLVGVLAAILWTGTLIGLFIIFRSSPKHPFRSIKEFRLARRRLSRPSGPLVEVVDEADLLEPPVFVDQRRRPSPPEPQPVVPIEEFEPAFQEDLEPEEPIDTAGLWDEDEGAQIEAEDYEDEEEEYWEDAEAGYEQDEYEEEEVLAEEQEDEEEGASSLDIILVDDFGKPAR